MPTTKDGVIIQFRSGLGQPYNAESEHEKNIIGTRISEARKKAGMTMNQLSDLLRNYGVDISGGAISKWEVGKNMPNPYHLMALCHALGISDPLRYFSVSYRPLLNDEGLRRISEYADDLVASGKYRPRPKKKAEIRYIDMPISNLRVSAGTGSLLDEGSFETVSFPESEVPDRAEFGVRVSGNSMEPVYHDGQIVWVERCEELNSGEVGVVIYDGEGYIKLYEEKEPNDGDNEFFIDSYGKRHMQPILISYNSSYQPIIINPTIPFHIVAHVLN